MLRGLIDFVVGTIAVVGSVGTVLGFFYCIGAAWFHFVPDYEMDGKTIRDQTTDDHIASGFVLCFGLVMIIAVAMLFGCIGEALLHGGTR